MQLSLGLKSLKHVTCLTLDLAVLFTQSCDTSAPPPLASRATAGSTPVGANSRTSL